MVLQDDLEPPQLPPSSPLSPPPSSRLNELDLVAWKTKVASSFAEAALSGKLEQELQECTFVHDPDRVVPYNPDSGDGGGYSAAKPDDTSSKIKLELPMPIVSGDTNKSDAAHADSKPASPNGIAGAVGAVGAVLGKKAQDGVNQAQGAINQVNHGVNQALHVGAQRGLGDKEVIEYGSEEIDLVFKAASVWAQKKHDFYEEKKGGAMEFLPPGHFIYVPKRLKTEKDGKVELENDFENATFDYHRDFNKFPGARVYFPLSRYQWNSVLFQWMTVIASESIDLLSDLNLCLSLLIDKKTYKNVPWWFIVTFTALTTVSIVCEIYIAGRAVLGQDYEHLTMIKKRYGWGQFLLALVQQTSMLYLRVPNAVLKNSFLCRIRDKNKGGEFAVVQYPTFTGAAFNEVKDFLPKLPRVLVEDFLLFGMTLYLVYYSGYLDTWTSATVFSSFLSLINLLKMIQESYTYVSRLRAYHRSLMAEKRHGIGGADGAMKSIMSHPANRLLCICNRPEQDDVRVAPSSRTSGP